MPLLSSVDNLLCIFYKCKQEKNILNLLHLGTHGRRSGLESHTSLGFQFTLFFLEFGNLEDAQQVFGRLSHFDDFSSNSLIMGYVKCGEWECALNVYHKTQENESIHSSGHAFVALLKACTRLRDLDTGREILCEIARKGFLERDVYIGCSLVDMFINCGSLSQAQELFDKLSIRNLAVWNALIAGYAEHGHGSEALRCYRQMQHEGFSPDSITLVCSLKAFGCIREIEDGQVIHFDIMRLGLEKETIIGNALVDMYVKCGSLDEAQAVCNMLQVQTVVSQTSLITGYVDQGRGEEALEFFERMQLKGTYVDVVTFVCSLKACGSIGAIDRGRKIHIETSRYGLERDLIVGSTLVDMYGRCGLLAEAREVFDKLPVQDDVSWTTLILGYVENGNCEEALRCFDCMHKGGLLLGSVTFACALRACGSLRAIEKGQEIHVIIIRTGFLDRDGCVGSTMVDMYAKCGSLTEAQDVFETLSIKSIVTWTSLIAGFVEHGHGEKAIECFEQMQEEGIFPSAITFVCTLKACTSMNAIDKGHALHIDIVKRGVLERETYVGSTLVDMYAKCGSLASALQVFCKLPNRNVVSWTALITGYTEQDRSEDALYHFKQMQVEGVSPVPVTFISAVKACGGLGVAEMGLKLHMEITKRGQETNLSVGHVLIDMYAKYGLLPEAHEVFDKLTIQDSVSWTALISGYMGNGAGEEALKCFKEIQSNIVFCLDLRSLVCILKACSGMGASLKGQGIHAESVRKGLETEPLLGNTLVDMYAKCGLIVEAQKVFDKLSVRDVISWSALIAGYAELGESEIVISTFDKMLGENIKPDLVTYVSVLNACSHAGLVERGQFYFFAISRAHGLTPSIEHFVCLVDLLSRAGHINKAIALIKEMPYESSNIVWQIVLGACRKWGDVEVGLDAFEQVVHLYVKDAAAYVCMFNIYADAAMQKEEIVGVEGQWELNNNQVSATARMKT